MVTVYTSKGCSACNMVKEYLSSKGVIYDEVDIMDNPEVAKSMANEGMLAVPIICKSGECVVGFDKEGIKKLIEDGE